MTVYEAREKGKEYCRTDGSEHYIRRSPEPLELIINSNYAEGFCLGNIIKYAARYEYTRDLTDIKKAVDYAHIFCGVVQKKKHEAKNELVAVADEAYSLVHERIKQEVERWPG